ncbi:hypothetical protein I3842_01G021100 [Carya illinoinensis]|uniref:Uncharacterized protein n=1 Tax=Carya illinoinensis TaxID=32201 RepID=A0A922K2Z2_CARIL|nr:hypothetical protein I3842_01G021100 [Carya illinoinensis]
MRILELNLNIMILRREVPKMGQWIDCYIVFFCCGSKIVPFFFQ